MLLVIAMAAAVAWILYMEMPRLAFEQQRNREEMLVERGGQFVRAVQMYARDQKRYPQTIEQLESTNGKRYLRRRYVDPFTGKDEWRFLHANAAGQVTDSLVKKKGDPNDPNASADANKQASGFGSNTIIADPNQPKPEAVRRRDSEMQGAAGGRLLPGQQGGDASGNSPEGLAPNQLIPGQMTPGQGGDGQQQPTNTSQNQPGANPNIPPGVFPPGLFPPGVSPTPANRPPGSNPSGYPTSASSSQTGGSTSGFGSGGGSAFGSSGPSSGGLPQVPPTPNSQGFGQGGFGQGGFGQGQPRPVNQGGQAGFNNNATSLIQNLLTRPNPNGLANALNNNNQGGFGEGIVGIASKVDREGIKIINERTNIKEWEFIYDASKENGGQGGQGANGQVNPNGQNGMGGQNGFGGQPGFGNQGGFGSQGGFGNPISSPGNSFPSGMGRRP